MEESTRTGSDGLWGCGIRKDLVRGLADGLEQGSCLQKGTSQCGGARLVILPPFLGIICFA